MATKLVLDADIRAFKSKVEEMGKVLKTSIGRKYKLDMDTAQLEKIGKVGGKAYDELIKKGQELAESLQKGSTSYQKDLEKEQKQLEKLLQIDKERAKQVQDLERMKKVVPVGFDESALAKAKAAKESSAEELKLAKDRVNEEFRIRKAKIQEEHRALKQNAYDRVNARSDMGFLGKGGASLKELGAGLAKRGGMLGKIGGGAASGMGGAMMGLGRIAGPVGMAASLGVGAYMGARALTAPARQMAGMNLQLRGLSRTDRGDANLDEMMSAGSEMGFTPFEMMQANIDAQRNLGEMTPGASRSMATMARQQGLGLDEVSNFASTFRRNAGGAAGLNAEGNLQKTRAMLVDAYVNAFDKSGQLAYMEAMTAGIEQMAEGGSADVQMLSSVMSGLAQQSEFFKADARRSGKVASGVSDMFQNREGFAFASLSNSLDAAGVEGISPAKLMALQKSGLFETSEEQYAELLGTDVDTARKVRTGAMDNFLKMQYEVEAGGNKDLLMSNLIDQGFAPSIAQEMANVVSSNKSIASSPELMKDLRKGAQMSTEKDLSGRDLDVKNVEAEAQKAMIRLGREALPLFNSIEKNVMAIANDMLGLEDKDKSSASLAYEKQQAMKEEDGIFQKLGLAETQEEKVKRLANLEAKSKMREGRPLTAEDKAAMKEYGEDRMNNRARRFRGFGKDESGAFKSAYAQRELRRTADQAGVTDVETLQRAGVKLNPSEQQEFKLIKDKKQKEAADFLAQGNDEKGNFDMKKLLDAVLGSNEIQRQSLEVQKQTNSKTTRKTNMSGAGGDSADKTLGVD